MLKNGSKITLFPYYAPMKVLYTATSGEKLYRVPFRLIREDGAAAVGYFGLFAAGYAPLEIYLGDVVGVDHDQLDSDDYFKTPNGGVVVGMNGVTSGERYFHSADYMTGAAQADGKNVFQQKVQSPEEMFRDLVEIYKDHGPIGQIVIAAHGAPGKISIGGTKLDADWVRSRPWLFANLPKDLLKPDAKIILISCNTAQGFRSNSKGAENDLKTIFGPLLKNGGTIVASTRYVNPDIKRIPIEYRDKSTAQQIGDHFLPPMTALIDTISFGLSDWDSMMHKTKKIRIEPNSDH